MIEIVKFNRKDNGIEIGYRKGIAVVYTLVSRELSDDEAKQKGYEKIWRTLEYEQMQEKPSFTVGGNADDEGNVIEYEEFTPATPKTTKVVVDGLTSITFDDVAETKIVEYKATAYDQYGEKVKDKTVEQSFNNEDYTQKVKVNIGEIEEVLNVRVYAYQEPQPSEVELMTDYVMDVDFRVAMLELGFNE